MKRKQKVQTEQAHLGGSPSPEVNHSVRCGTSAACSRSSSPRAIKHSFHCFPLAWALLFASLPAHLGKSHKCSFTWYVSLFYSAEAVGWMNPESEVGARGGPDPVLGHMHGLRISGPCPWPYSWPPRVWTRASEHRSHGHSASWLLHFYALLCEDGGGRHVVLSELNPVWCLTLGSGGKRSSELNRALL